jgi:hypothetical protein
MSNPNHFLNQFHPDEEFLDPGTLVGHAYTMAIKICSTPNKALRHHLTLHLIGGIIDRMTPSCEGCGASLQHPLCDVCRRRMKGILNITNL